MKYAEYKKSRHAAIVTMTHPEVLNVMNMKMSKELA